MKRRQFLISSLVVIIGLAIPFLWNENLSLSKKINHEKISAYFTIVASLGAAYSIFLIYRQTSIMYESNRSANKPDLFIEEKIWFVEELKDSDKIDSDPWVATIPWENGGKDYEGSAEIKIYNAGNGVAKHVKATWDFDSNEIQKNVESIYSNIFQKRLKFQTTDFIKPDRDWGIWPPIEYMQVCGPKLNRNPFLESNPNSDTLKEKPKLQLHLEYQDISSFTIKKSFNVNVDAIDDIVVMEFKESTT